MTTITFKQKKNLGTFKWLFFSFIIVAVNPISAQLQNDGSLFIGDDGYVYLEATVYNFGSGSGQTTTTRTATHGKLIFSSASTTSGATNTHYLDGYASLRTTDAFLLPTGQSGVYAPARITPVTSVAVDAAYYEQSTATIGSALDATLNLVSSSEYWNIQGTNSAKITLTWRPTSVLTNLVFATDDLTIAGYDGAKWVEIPSAVDATAILGGTSTLTSGSISSAANVDVTTYKYFTFAAKATAACAPLVASSGITKTWNGSWSPSAPTLTDPVVISTPYAAGSFACNALVLNANVTLSDGQNIEVINAVTGAGKLLMSSEATLVQRASIATAPSIELTKKTRSAMRQYDYVYWGTPIAGNFFSQIANAQASTATFAGAFDASYKYVAGAGGGWQSLSTVETGSGFITRVKPQAPFTNATNMDFINFKFTGLANNGDITIPITNNPANIDGGTSHILLANPYPSAIDAETFLTDNTDIDGVVYLWTAASVNNGTGQLYSQADYIAYTLAGAVVPSAIATTFNGKIASGQGFKVKSLTNNGSVTFTNCMRLLANNNQFYKTIQQKAAPKDRFKLNMTGNNGVFSQILISYLPNATLGYDRLYDAGRNSVSTAQLYSILDSDNRKLSINARPTFNATDVVNLGVSKTAIDAEDFFISITEKEGLFADGSVPVYLFDSALNTYHNFADGTYKFNANATELNSRFKIVYANNTLANPDFDAEKVTASINRQTLKISSSVPMTNVTIYDITGRMVTEIRLSNQRELTQPFRFAHGIYIAKIKMNNGLTATQKIINN